MAKENDGHGCAGMVVVVFVFLLMVFLLPAILVYWPFATPRPDHFNFYTPDSRSHFMIAFETVGSSIWGWLFSAAFWTGLYFAFRKKPPTQ